MKVKRLISTKNTKSSWAGVVARTCDSYRQQQPPGEEAEAGDSLEPGSLGLQ